MQQELNEYGNWSRSRRLLSSWLRGCNCENCARSDDICTYCMDFREEIHEREMIICGNINCTNSYHITCLEEIGKKFRINNSWNECNDLGSLYQCDFSNAIRFCWYKPLKIINNIQKYVENIQLYDFPKNEMKKAIKIFDAFLLNGTPYKCGDHILCEWKKRNKIQYGVGEIMEIYKKNDNFGIVIINWYSKKYDDSILIQKY